MCCLSSTVTARTAPKTGAVVKPRRFKIRSPFPCGVKFQISCGYATRAHKRRYASKSTNDYYALDLTRLEEKSGYNKAVVAVASGIVRYSGWTRGGWEPYGKVVYIEHDYRDHRGRRYQTLYAHLHKVKVWQGQRVQAGEIIGTVGGSSRGRYLRFGPHLHFAMYRGARPWLGGGRAVVPEPMGAYENLRKGMVLEACGRPDRQLTFVPFESSCGGLP